MQNAAAFIAPQVEGEAAFVAVLVLEIGFVAAGKILGISRALDPDDVGAPVGELAHADGPGARVGQVEHHEVGKRLRGRVVCHANSADYSAMIALARSARRFGVASTSATVF